MASRAPWRPVLGAWLVMSLVLAIQVDLGGLFPELDLDVARTALWLLVANFAWVLAVPVVAALTRRIPVVGASWLRGVSLHMVLAVAFAVGHTWVAVLVAGLIGPLPDLAFSLYLDEVGYLLGASIHLELLVYWAIVGVTRAFDAQREIREHERRAAALELSLGEARLRTLEAQLQPHFFFNALNTIAMLVRSEQPERAVWLISEVGHLVRHALRRETLPVPLDRELEFVRHYLAVEQIRFEDRLVVEVDAPAGSEAALVPHWILQPLVENAIRHGIGEDPRASLVRVHCRIRAGELTLCVENDGPGPPRGASDGVGLANVRERLRLLYGAAAGLALTREGERTRAMLHLPLSLGPAT